ncbi:hypothetical protein Dsin_031761 [Dipteronia sinensis]|uniref:Uncharacterized protein n=1 Tax=Dipteronia sinensis TaxID=43782 RepID=A0AAE0DTN9_9ROSI|nr:hypothetical protein Dsin_031761 [Dipteronia sinensis]
MFRMLAVMRRNLQNVRKSPKVADENMMLGAGGAGGNVIINNNGAEVPILVHEIHTRARGGRWNAFSVIYSVVRAPLSIISCFSQPHVNGADGVWVSGGEFAQISEMNHLMVSDSMRYAILM